MENEYVPASSVAGLVSSLVSDDCSTSIAADSSGFSSSLLSLSVPLLLSVNFGKYFIVCTLKIGELK